MSFSLPKRRSRTKLVLGTLSLLLWSQFNQTERFNAARHSTTQIFKSTTQAVRHVWLSCSTGSNFYLLLLDFNFFIWRLLSWRTYQLIHGDLILELAAYWLHLMLSVLRNESCHRHVTSTSAWFAHHNKHGLSSLTHTWRWDIALKVFLHDILKTLRMHGQHKKQGAVFLENHRQNLIYSFSIIPHIESGRPFPLEKNCWHGRMPSRC